MTAKLLLEAGPETEDLVRYVTGELDDTTLDELEIDRKPAESHGLANELITSAVIITLGTATVSVVARLIERWLEIRRQTDVLKIVAAGFAQSDEAGRALADLAKKHSEVSVAYGTVPVSWTGGDAAAQCG